MTSKIITILLISASLAGLLFALNKTTYPELPSDLVFQRIDGEEQTLQEMKGKPVLVTFWSTNCPLCIQDIGLLNRLYAKHQGGEKFELLAPAMFYDRPDSILEISTKNNMQYPVYFDLQKKLSNAFGNIVATPTSFLLNSSGEIIYYHTGRLDFPVIDKKLTQLTG